MDTPELPDKRTVLEIASAIEYVKRKRLTPEQQRIHEIAEVFSDDTQGQTPPLTLIYQSLQDSGLNLHISPVGSEFVILGVSIADYAKYTAKGLLGALHIAGAFARGYQWVIGDLVNLGTDIEGEIFAQFFPDLQEEDREGKIHTVSNWASVCTSFAIQERIYCEQGLYFGHYECLSALSDVELLPVRVGLLQDASANKWTVAKLRQEKYARLQDIASSSDAAKRVLKNLKSGDKKVDDFTIKCNINDLTDYVRLEHSDYAKIVARIGEGRDVRVKIEVFGV